MCSIMGYTGKDLALDALLQGFEKTKSRGPDMCRHAALYFGRRFRSLQWGIVRFPYIERTIGRKGLPVLQQLGL